MLLGKELIVVTVLVLVLEPHARDSLPRLVTLVSPRLLSFLQLPPFSPMLNPIFKKLL
jgi:hypothetical protein